MGAVYAHGHLLPRRLAAATAASGERGRRREGDAERDPGRAERAQASVSWRAAAAFHRISVAVGSPACRNGAMRT